MIHIDFKFYQYLKNNISKKVRGNDIFLVIHFKNACLYHIQSHIARLPILPIISKWITFPKKVRGNDIFLVTYNTNACLYWVKF